MIPGRTIVTDKQQTLLQVLVQSRSGGAGVFTFEHSSPAPSGTLGVAVDEIGELSAYLKLNFPSYPVLPDTLNIDFILHTVGGYDLPLESWRMVVSHEDGLGVLQTHTLLFQDMSVLLRSVICASRATPAFRHYVRDQSEDTFVFTYRVYEGASQIDLGPGSKRFLVGTVKTKYGCVTVDLRYRTKMEFEQSMHCSVSRIDHHILHSKSIDQHPLQDAGQVPCRSKQGTRIMHSLATNSQRLQSTFGCLKRKVPQEPVEHHFPGGFGIATSESNNIGIHAAVCHPCCSKMTLLAAPLLNVNERAVPDDVLSLSSDECKENEIRRSDNSTNSNTADDELLCEHSINEGSTATESFILMCMEASHQNFQFPRRQCFESLMDDLEYFETMRHTFDRFVAEVTSLSERELQEQ